jgi:hypothetical protein
MTEVCHDMLNRKLRWNQLGKSAMLGLLFLAPFVACVAALAYMGHTHSRRVEALHAIQRMGGEAHLKCKWKDEVEGEFLEIDMRNARLTDAQVDYIITLKPTERLLLGSTQLTENGLKRLRQALPRCRIIAARVGCTPDNSAKEPVSRKEVIAPMGSSGDEKQLQPEAGSGKEMYGDLTVLPVHSAAELAEIKRCEWLQYLGRDDQHYYLFRYTAVANRRTHIYVYSVAKATVAEGELLNGLARAWPADYQPPALPDLVSWIEKNKIDLQPLERK